MNNDAIYDALVKLLPSQFEEVIYRLGVSWQYLSPSTVAQAVRALELVRYLNQQGRVSELRNAILSVGGFVHDVSTSISTSLKESTPMTDLSHRSIHSDHQRGVRLLARDALALASDDDAKTALADLLLDDATYRELPQLGGVDLAVAVPVTLATIKAALPSARIVPVRVGEFLAAARSVTPSRRFCKKCFRLDLQRDAGAWVPTTGDYCQSKVSGPVCGGLLSSVAFEPDVRAWTDGRDYPPGTTHDNDRLPITDAAIRQWVTPRGDVHPLLDRGLAASQGALDLPALCAYLVASHRCSAPLGALNALVKPFESNLFHDASSAEVLCRRALESRGHTTATVETGNGGTAQVVVSTVGRKYTGSELAVLRKALADAIPFRKNARDLVSEIGLDTTRIDFDGSANTMWSEILTEVNKHTRVDAIVARAVLLYPDEPSLLALRG